MRFNFTFTMSDWWPLLMLNEPDWPKYAAAGIGPFYLELYWGSGLAPWEQ